ncbi:MAG: nucleotide exchange factor GrpE [Verrucomicrobiaceae bacterium]|jgi:molecular chaperone GrpE|nr:nucleotide exchange factor GrpE [Verrucomicrobiaceae bacterium]
MQEPTQESEDPINQENPAEESSEQAPQEANEAAEKPTEEEEIDPWQALELEAAKWKDQAIRTAAELDNFRKRMSREKLDAVRYGNQSLLEELLPVLDNFDMGMQAAAQEEGSMLFMGMQMIHKQLDEFLSSQNVEEIPTEVGGDFDPKVHEALGQEASDEIEDGKIIRVVRKGYRIGERLLRPSNIIVAHNDEAADAASNDQ